jgi:hypothetical protein
MRDHPIPGALWWAVFVSVFAMGAGGPDPGAGATRPTSGGTATLAEICGTVAEWRGRLRSLLVEYDARGPVRRTGEPDPTVTRRVVAVRGPCRYIHSVHFTDEFPSGVDLKCNEIYYDGRSLVDYSLHDLHANIYRRQAERLSWKTRCEFFLECLGWWPPDDETAIPDRGQGFFLHQALADPRCRLLPERETVDGASCYVVERLGIDKIWLDPGLGFAPRRREWNLASRSAPSTTYELSDYREAAPGVNLPWRLHRVIYDPSLVSARNPQGVDADTRAVVIRAEVNRVAEDRFAFTPPPGALVREDDTDVIQQVAGGTAFLNSVAELAERRAMIYARRRPNTGTIWERVNDRLPLTLVVALATADVIWVGVLLGRRRKPKPEGRVAGASAEGRHR